MRYGYEWTLSNLGAVAAFGVLAAAALEVSLAATPAVDGTSVNRTLKGDRLDVRRGSPVRTMTDPKLPDGCLSATEWRRANIYTSEVPGRCVA